MEANATDQSLAGFVSSLSGGDGLRVEESLGSGFVRLRVAEAERRQAKHDIRCVEDATIEMLRNARDAGATRIFVAMSRDKDVRTLVVVDDGSGIPDHMHERVFDARVTSKLDTMSMDKWGVHGRGMALYSIRENAQEATVCQSELGRGAALLTRFDVGSIRERADQSSWPTLVRSNGSYEVRGPRNVLRACVDFALECGDSCRVYVGSPSEIAATIRMRVGTDEDLVMAGLARATTARELQEHAALMGLDMSERTAHRIVSGQITPLRNVRTLMLGSGAHAAKPQEAPRRLALTDADREAFAKTLSDAFEELAQKYYLALDAPPRIRVADGILTATFEYREDS